MENEKIKILWDFNVYTDRKIEARKPDIIVIDNYKGKKNKKAKLINISVPTDTYIGLMERKWKRSTSTKISG